MYTLNVKHSCILTTSKYPHKGVCVKIKKKKRKKGMTRVYWAKLTVLSHLCQAREEL